MTTKYRARGAVVDYTPGSAVTSGTAVLLGAKLGVALTDIAANLPGSVQIAGVFEIAKLSTDVVAQGALLYWDNTNFRLTVTSAGNTLAGHAHKAAGSGAATVEICLNSIPF